MPRSRARVGFAWAGGLMFLLALAWFLYSYTITFGVPATGTNIAGPLVVDILLFSAFALHHSLFARTGLKARVRTVIPPELERSVYTWVASLLFLAVCTLWQPVPGVLYRLPIPFSLGALLLQTAAVVITIRAAAAVDALDLAGVRPVLLAQRNQPQRRVALLTSGVYGFVRHPLYFAWALFVFAAPVMTGTRAVFAVVSTLYLTMAIPWEERDLLRDFGREYESYRRRVRWRMVPGVY